MERNPPGIAPQGAGTQRSAGTTILSNTSPAGDHAPGHSQRTAHEHQEHHRTNRTLHHGKRNHSHQTALHRSDGSGPQDGDPRRLRSAGLRPRWRPRFPAAVWVIDCIDNHHRRLEQIITRSPYDPFLRASRPLHPLFYLLPLTYCFYSRVGELGTINRRREEGSHLSHRERGQIRPHSSFFRLHQ
jgi:hypothetical protein